MPIDRHALVDRHAVRLHAPDALSPLSVGSGEFAFTADVTGLQTFSAFHADAMPLGTFSQWGWHTFPNPHNYCSDDALTVYETPRGPVPYADTGAWDSAESPAAQWLRANPHRLNLGQIGFARPGGPPLLVEDVSKVSQTLDLWQGQLRSAWTLDGQAVQVFTVCHPQLDFIAVRVKSPLLAAGTLAVQIAFPCGRGEWRGAEDWANPNKHQTQAGIVGNRCDFTRTLDADHYAAALHWAGGDTLAQDGPHRFTLTAGSDTLEFVMAFAPNALPETLPTFAETQEAAATHWESFWTQGGAVDFSQCTDPRAPELERRVVLSQFLTAIHCAGSAPPQETGLVCNSWFGKAHLEMHWWHAAHFPLWGREQLLARSLPWYEKILPRAQETARRQGYAGARWPKMVGPDGQDSPSRVGVFLIWQQPHPIYFAELCWRAGPSPDTLARYQNIVMETAAFMASFPIIEDGRAVLGPAPHSRPGKLRDACGKTVRNPTYELAYWHWGLETAQLWRERGGLPRDPDWERIKNALPKPTVRDGVYAAIETAPYTIYKDHPSMTAAYGMLPPSPLIDPDTMRRTLDHVYEHWEWADTWGWDFPMLAMCAARLGQPERAIDTLLLDTTKNTYLANGHNFQTQPRLPLYLPGNGGLLMAIGMMAGGWDGAPAHAAPGFPQNGQWDVQVEGLRPMP